MDLSIMPEAMVQTFIEILLTSASGVEVAILEALALSFTVALAFAVAVAVAVVVAVAAPDDV